MPRFKTHRTTPVFLNKMRSRKKAYYGTILGVRVKVLPNVWSPIYDWTGKFMIENLPDVSDKYVLEIGCGSGIISLFCGLRGAKRVDATDINPDAVKNANQNYRSKHVNHICKAIYSDTFSNIKEKYNLIVFNAPFHGARPNNMLERSVTDLNYRTLRHFLSQAGNYLLNDGIIMLGFSSSGDTTLLNALLNLNSLIITKKFSDVRSGYNCDIYMLSMNNI